jgi:rhodanese-related sulfurtransferase
MMAFQIDVAYRKMATEVFILLSLAVVAAFIVNHFSPSGIALFGQWKASSGVVSARARDGVVFSAVEIETVQKAKAIFDGGHTVFVDARSAQQFSQGHILGAISFPVGAFDDLIFSFEDRYPYDRHIVTYCSGRSCEDSHRLARMLMDFGFSKVSVFIDGYLKWDLEGFPVER